jgi:hypothetical protein
MDSLRLTLLLSIGLFFNVVQEKVQVPTSHPDLIAGPWDSLSASGIDGVFFQIETSSTGPSRSPQIAWQTIDIRVYHRQGGKETWGWFATKDKATPESYNRPDDHSFTLFDGERLRIHFTDVTDLKPFDLDITLSPTAHVWTGTWSRSGQAFNVVLERPHPNTGVTPNVFVGDWEGEVNPPSHTAPGSIHIRESRDGVLSAWLDRTISGMDPKTRSVQSDQRNGELLQVNSVTESGLNLETNSVTSPAYQYRGSLSEDSQVLTGNWGRGSGGRLNAPDRFRRVR